MKRVAFFCAFLFIWAGSARAQVNQTDSVNSEFSAASFEAASPTNALFALASRPVSAMAMSEPVASAWASPMPAEPQGVYGVFQEYDWQVYGGYTFLKFYEVPGTLPNMNGFDFDVDYYPHASSFGIEGGVTGVFASVAGVNDKLATGMGGVHYRWSKQGRADLWVHGLVGVAHLVPQTAFGGTNAFGYELGGGLDMAAGRSKRFGYRLEGDLVGTTFFGTTQYSPKVSVGIFYKF
jgi:hypothetical protein